tara:strand:+ start:154 stop:510 length:357 start_codon:yes stop_codon:yes gene_type:complete
MSSYWQRFKKGEKAKLATHTAESSEEVVIRDGNLEFTREAGAGNDSQPSYQEASGAPVEKESPLGYKVNWFTIIFLNIGQMIGTGVFSTRMLLIYFSLPWLESFSLREACAGQGADLL